jgi:enterochelin esterase-like enzyme
MKFKQDQLRETKFCMIKPGLLLSGFIRIAVVFTTAIFISVFSACSPLVSARTVTPTSTKEPISTGTEVPPTAIKEATSTQTEIPPTATLAPEPMETKEACLLVKGQLKEVGVFIGGMSEPMDFSIYLPPCYEEQNEREFPILYLIHGKDYLNDQWVNLGLINVANELIASEQIPPMIIVLPEDIGAEYPEEDSFDEDFLNDVVPYIEDQYSVKEGRENRVLGGLSRGAGWALHIGLNNPEMFSALGMHSLAIFNIYETGEIEGWLDEIALEDMPRIYIDHGEDEFDMLKNSIAEFIDDLDERGFEYEFNIFPGAHNDEYWSSYVDRYLLFYASGWD